LQLLIISHHENPRAQTCVIAENVVFLEEGRRLEPGVYNPPRKSRAARPAFCKARRDPSEKDSNRRP
jgi:hypothetical protein